MGKIALGIWPRYDRAFSSAAVRFRQFRRISLRVIRFSRASRLRRVGCILSGVSLWCGAHGSVCAQTIARSIARRDEDGMRELHLERGGASFSSRSKRESCLMRRRRRLSTSIIWSLTRVIMILDTCWWTFYRASTHSESKAHSDRPSKAHGRSPGECGS